jgi:cytochrome c-type biogenesis protein CcmH
MNDDIPALRQQLQQLAALHEAGTLDDATYQTAKAGLERRLIDQVLAAPADPLRPAPGTQGAAVVRPGADAAAVRPGRGLVLALGAGVLAIAAAGYALTGSPGAVVNPPQAAAAAAAAGDGSADAGHSGNEEQQFAAAVEKLAQRLKDQPDNAEGWAMLARSYARLGRHAEAAPAYDKAVALQAGDAALLADYADTLAVQNNRSLQGEPTKLIERALKIDAQHPKALALAGSAAFERRDYAAAVRYWETLGRVLPADNSFMPQLQASIDQARELGGLPKGTPLQAALPAPTGAPTGAGATAGPAGAAAATPAPAASASAPAAAATAAVKGSVRLAPALARLAAPTDTVFVFARAAEGPRMPLAILRFQVKDLPLQFTLDDSTAMSPAMRLSLHPKVVISARISKSGQAVPAAGDLTGQSGPISNESQGVAIEIGEIVK